MAYHHLALAAKDMKATHAFYEGIMGFELVKVEVAPIMGGGWGKHFFYRMDGDDSRFIAFWELHETDGSDDYVYDINAAAKLPPGTNHYSFSVDTKEELESWKQKWLAAGLDVFEHEPAVNPKLLALDNVVLLPHMSSATFEGRIDMGEKVAINIQAFVDKHTPPDIVLGDSV